MIMLSGTKVTSPTSGFERLRGKQVSVFLLLPQNRWTSRYLILFSIKDKIQFLFYAFTHTQSPCFYIIKVLEHNDRRMSTVIFDVNYVINAR